MFIFYREDMGEVLYLYFLLVINEKAFTTAIRISTPSAFTPSPSLVLAGTVKLQIT